MGAAYGAIIGALSGAGTGMLKAQEDKQKSQREQALAVAQTRAAPLFTFQTKQPTALGQISFGPTQFDRVLEGTLAGAKMGSQFGMGQSKSSFAQSGPQTGAQSMSGQPTQQYNMYDPNQGQQTAMV